MKDAALAAASVTQTTGLFLAILPGVKNMRETSTATQFAAEVRTAEALATALALGTGVAMGAIGKSRAPVVAAAVTTAGMLIVAEWLLRTKKHPTLRLVRDTDGLHTEGIPDV